MASITDISKVVAQDDEGAIIPIYQKNGDPYEALDGTQSTFTVVGSESKQYRAAKRAHLMRLQKRARRSGGSSISPEQMEKDARDLVAAAVIGFHGWDDGKEELKFTPETVSGLLEFEHIFEQVNVGVQGHSDFFLANSGS